MEFDTNIPIYLQIMGKIKLQIITGHYNVGDRVPAVRELALEFGVNPNTMQRALSELERENLLFSERTSGRFITMDQNLISAVREELAKEIVKDFIRRMNELKFKSKDISAYISEELKEEGTNE